MTGTKEEAASDLAHYLTCERVCVKGRQRSL